MSCPSCGAAIAEDARFCAQCGTPIVQAPGAMERRKTVTVLFTDLVESTTMAERLDPEALSAVLGRYFAVARSIVERHGGVVEKFIGDAVVAMFGVAQVREDDGLRAVRTALELRDAVAGLNSELEPAFGVRLRLRTGINTGEVLVDEARADSLAVGHAISMAARLEQAAGPDEVVVGEPTYRLVASGIVATAIEPLAVKGSSVLLNAWRIDRLLATPARGSRSGGTYLGRQAELETVAATYEEVVRQARSGGILVIAPPGLGKTRFAAELETRLDPRPRIALGRGVDDGGSTYGPLIYVLRQLGAGEEGGEFEALVAALPDGRQVARSARALVDGSGVATAGDVGWVVRRAAMATARERPLAIVLDDLHWTDPLLLGVVADLVDPPLAAPVFILGLSRPELLEDQRPWLERLAAVPVVRLRPLSTDDAEELVREHLGPDADEGQRRRVVEAAAGVPLFVEQLAALDAESTLEAVPVGMKALMAARIDRIAGDARRVVEIAAIAGEAFTSADVAQGEGVDVALDSLVRREILRADGTDADGYRFWHGLLRDAVIDALPRRRRAELHERRAAQLEATVDVDLERVGFHLEAAWHERTAIGLPDDHAKALARRSAEALAAAGRRSLARKEWHRAVGLLGRGERLLAGDPARADILPDLIDALVHARDLETADRIHDEAVRIARDPLDRARADTAWARAPYARRVDGWPELMRAIAEASIEVFERARDDAWLARAHILLFMSSKDDVSELAALKRARVHAERAGDERSVIEIWDELGGAMLFGSTPYSEVLDFVHAELAWARERGVAFTEADGMLGEAYALAGLGDVESARVRIDAVGPLFEALPSVVEQLGEAWMLEAAIVRDTGDLVASRDDLVRAVDVFEACGEAGWTRSARLSLVHAELDLGHASDAAELLHQVRLGRPGPAWFQGQVAAADARIALQRGDIDIARELALAGSAAVNASSTHRNTLRALELLGDVLTATGDIAAARTAYEDGCVRAHAKEDRVAEPRLRAKIERLRVAAEAGRGAPSSGP